MRWLQTDVSDLAGEPGASRDLAAAGTIPGLRSGLGWVEDGEPVHVRFTLTGVEEGILARGQVRGRMHLQCSRCLIDYGQDFGLSLEETFYFDAERAEEKEGYVITDQSVDLEPMLRDAVVLDIPIKPVHADECRGLCAVCGGDLNLVDCGHTERSTDPRWAPLAALAGGEGRQDLQVPDESPSRGNPGAAHRTREVER